MLLTPVYKKLLVSYSAIFLCVSVLIIGGGLSGTITAIGLSNIDAPQGLVGLIMGMYSVGAVVATRTSTKLINHVGHIRVFAAFVGMASGAFLLHFYDNLFPPNYRIIFLFCLRFIEGFTIVTAQVVVENWLVAIAIQNWRGRILNVYLVVNYLSFGISQSLLIFGADAMTVSMQVLSFMVSFAAVPLMLIRIAAPPLRETESFEVKATFRRLISETPGSLATVFAGGICQSAMMSLVPQYAIGVLGLDINMVGVAMILLSVGAASGAFLSSRAPTGSNRRLQALFCSTVALSFALVIALSESVITGLDMPYRLFAPMALSAMVIGAVIPLYAIGFSHASERLELISDPSLTSNIMMTFVSGAALGPILGGLANTFLGGSGLWFMIAIVMSLNAMYAIYRSLLGPYLKIGQRVGLVVNPGYSQTMTASALHASIVETSRNETDAQTSKPLDS